jgi:hypothetical protein
MTGPRRLRDGSSTRIPQLKVIEGQTWSSEDTRLFIFKVSFGAGSQLHLLNGVVQRTDSRVAGEN